MNNSNMKYRDLRPYGFLLVCSLKIVPLKKTIISESVRMAMTWEHFIFNLKDQNNPMWLKPKKRSGNGAPFG